MSLSTLQEVISFVLRATKKDAIAVVFHGGEPLLLSEEWFISAVKLLRREGQRHGKYLKVNLQSNGTLITSDLADFFREQEIIVGVSCDGPQDLHNTFRSGFDATLCGIQTLRKHGVDFGIICVVSPAHVSRMNDVVSFFLSQGLRNVQFNIFHPTGRGQLLRSLEAKEIFQTRRFLLDLLLEGQDNGILPGHIIRKVMAFAGYQKKNRGSSCHQLPCSGGREILAVSPKGDLYPCGCAIHPAWLMGNVFDKRKEISPVSNSFYRMDQRCDCNNCPASIICDMGCPAVEADIPNFFGTQCESDRELYSYMLSKRKEVFSCAEKLVLKTRRWHKRNAQDLQTVLTGRRNLFRRLYESGETVCTVTKQKNNLSVTFGTEK